MRFPRALLAALCLALLALSPLRVQAQCTTNEECDDGVFCNGSEACVDSACVNTPLILDDGVACTQDACDEVDDLVLHTPDDAICSNDAFCDGAEVCDLLQGCLAGAPPLLDDGVACTQDACDEVDDLVLHTPDHAVCSNDAFCDGSEVCDLLQGCLAGAPPLLDDGDRCTIDECDESADLVVHRTGPFGLPGSGLPPQQIGEWGAVMAWPAQATHSIVIPPGKVLWWRGSSTSQILPTYVWDPATQQNAAIIPPTGHMLCMGHSTLGDGRVLAMGGWAPDVDPPFTVAFDPFEEAWTRMADMHYGRYYPTATTLASGRVMVMSGRISGPLIATIPEIYHPALDIWTELPEAEILQPLYPNNFLLPDGRLLWSHLVSAVLDFQTMSWQTLPRATGHAGHGVTSAMYAPGVVLRTGEADGITEVLDMNAGSPQWQQVGSMKYPRELHSLVVLPDGSVLTIGGTLQEGREAACSVHEAELWNPSTGSWRSLASMQRLRSYHSSAVLLPDGRVLAAGGDNSEVPGGETNAELYSPPYLFQGTRPSIGSVPEAVRYGETFRVNTLDAGSIAEVALMRPAATTHAFDQNQLRVLAAFSAGESYLDVEIGTNADVLPPGYYMLFLIDAAGVPSVAEFMRVEAAPIVDTDGDAVDDAADNCLGLFNPDQRNRDADGFGDVCDACPDHSTPNQDDVDGNGIGDECECGDQNEDGVVDVTDLVDINQAIFGSIPVSPLCDTNDDALCNVSDIVGANLKIFGKPAYCSRYPMPPQ